MDLENHFRQRLVEEMCFPLVMHLQELARVRDNDDKADQSPGRHSDFWVRVTTSWERICKMREVRAGQRVARRDSYRYRRVRRHFAEIRT